jgi:acetyl esterase/lipase
LRVPKSADNPPLVVFIPMAGMRQCLPKKTPWWLTELGFAMASIDCRGSTEATAPAAVHDCKAAVRWLRANASEFGYRPDSIGVWGHSAGGLLAALLGTSSEVVELEGDGPHGDVSSSVQAVCDECGAPHDLGYFAHPEVQARFPDVTENLRLYLGGPVEQHLDLARAVSPRTYLSAHTPPMLLLHGEQDPLVPVEETIAFYDALKSKADVTLRTLPGVGHSWDSSLTRDDIAAFFERTLKRRAPRSRGA